MVDLFGINKKIDKRRETSAFKLDSVASSHSRRGKIPDPKTRTDGDFHSWQTNGLVEST